MLAWTIAAALFLLFITTANAGARARAKLVVLVLRGRGPHTCESIARSIREDRLYVRGALNRLLRHEYVEPFKNMRGETCYELTDKGKSLGPG